MLWPPLNCGSAGGKQKKMKMCLLCTVLQMLLFVTVIWVKTNTNPYFLATNSIFCLDCLLELFLHLKKQSLQGECAEDLLMCIRGRESTTPLIAERRRLVPCVQTDEREPEKFWINTGGTLKSLGLQRSWKSEWMNFKFDALSNPNVMLP